MLRRIVQDDYDGQYYQLPESGDYKPAGYDDAVPGRFSVTGISKVS
jgi:hypothetical protein